LVYPEELLARIEAAPASPWSGRAYRHMVNDFPPTLQNTAGARWNPRDVAAIYASLERDAALAEANHRLSLEPLRPRVSRRTIYELRVELADVVDLSATGALADVGVGDEQLRDFDFSVCQLVGGAVAFLGHDGLIVPSARFSGLNLVIFPTALQADAQLEVVAEEDVTDAEGQ
jgi:RES domain-containing protein